MTWFVTSDRRLEVPPNSVGNERSLSNIYRDVQSTLLATGNLPFTVMTFSDGSSPDFANARSYICEQLVSVYASDMTLYAVPTDPEVVSDFWRFIENVGLSGTLLGSFRELSDKLIEDGKTLKNKDQKIIIDINADKVTVYRKFVYQITNDHGEADPTQTYECYLAISASRAGATIDFDNVTVQEVWNVPADNLAHSLFNNQSTSDAQNADAGAGGASHIISPWQSIDAPFFDEALPMVYGHELPSVSAGLPESHMSLVNAFQRDNNLDSLTALVQSTRDEEAASEGEADEEMGDTNGGDLLCFDAPEFGMFGNVAHDNDCFQNFQKCLAVILLDYVGQAEQLTDEQRDFVRLYRQGLPECSTAHLDGVTSEEREKVNAIQRAMHHWVQYLQQRYVTFPDPAHQWPDVLRQMLGLYNRTDLPTVSVMCPDDFPAPAQYLDADEDNHGAENTERQLHIHLSSSQKMQSVGGRLHADLHFISSGTYGAVYLQDSGLEFHGGVFTLDGHPVTEQDKILLAMLGVLHINDGAQIATALLSAGSVSRRLNFGDTLQGVDVDDIDDSGRAEGESLMREGSPGSDDEGEADDSLGLSERFSLVDGYESALKACIECFDEALDDSAHQAEILANLETWLAVYLRGKLSPNTLGDEGQLYEQLTQPEVEKTFHQLIARAQQHYFLSPLGQGAIKNLSPTMIELLKIYNDKNLGNKQLVLTDIDGNLVHDGQVVPCFKGMLERAQSLGVDTPLFTQNCLGMKAEELLKVYCMNGGVSGWSHHLAKWVTRAAMRRDLGLPVKIITSRDQVVKDFFPPGEYHETIEVIEQQLYEAISLLQLVENLEPAFVNEVLLQLIKLSLLDFAWAGSDIAWYLYNALPDDALTNNCWVDGVIAKLTVWSHIKPSADLACVLTNLNQFKQDPMVEYLNSIVNGLNNVPKDKQTQAEHYLRTIPRQPGQGLAIVFSDDRDKNLLDLRMAVKSVNEAGSAGPVNLRELWVAHEGYASDQDDTMGSDKRQFSRGDGAAVDVVAMDGHESSLTIKTHVNEMEGVGFYRERLASAPMPARSYSLSGSCSPARLSDGGRLSAGDLAERELYGNRHRSRIRSCSVVDSPSGAALRVSDARSNQHVVGTDVLAGFNADSFIQNYYRTYNWMSNGKRIGKSCPATIAGSLLGSLPTLALHFNGALLKSSLLTSIKAVTLLGIGVAWPIAITVGVIALGVGLRMSYKKGLKVVSDEHNHVNQLALSDLHEEKRRLFGLEALSRKASKLFDTVRGHINQRKQALKKNAKQHFCELKHRLRPDSDEYVNDLTNQRSAIVAIQKHCRGMIARREVREERARYKIAGMKPLVRAWLERTRPGREQARAVEVARQAEESSNAQLSALDERGSSIGGSEGGSEGGESERRDGQPSGEFSF